MLLEVCFHLIHRCVVNLLDWESSRRNYVRGLLRFGQLDYFVLVVDHQVIWVDKKEVGCILLLV